MTRAVIHHSYERFIEACGGDIAKIHVQEKAKRDALQQFDLKTTAELLSHIHQNSFLDLDFAGSGIWQPAPREFQGCYVDGYTFISDFKFCYMAFTPHPRKKGYWALKSFHVARYGQATHFDTPFRSLAGPGRTDLEQTFILEESAVLSGDRFYCHERGRSWTSS